MTFSPTIDIGNLLTLLGMAITVFWFVAKLTSDIRMLVSEIAAIKVAVAKFGDALVTVARQDERMAAADVRSNTLRQNMDALNVRLTELERELRRRPSDDQRRNRQQ